ncbi:MAG: fluoride efflux transporter CrcB [Ignavibacteriales bacterium]|nr:fluoride efflux transporter CrcB [Ignavibacteriales bacterium]
MPTTLSSYVLVFVGGGIGASARYWLSGFVYEFLPANFPYGNLIVNVLGCFLIGVLMTSMEERFAATAQVRLFLAVGILGGFTTFSSFSYETIALLRDADILKACVNIVVSVAGCLVATFSGMVVGKLV